MENTKSSGIGFTGLLTILFIGLKLGHVIDWSWWWVLSPIWLPFVVVLVIFFGAAAGVFLLTVIPELIPSTRVSRKRPIKTRRTFDV